MPSPDSDNSAPVQSVVITHSIVQVWNGKPTALYRGDIPVLCMYLLRIGAKDAAGTLARLTKWKGSEFMPLDEPKAHEAKTCACPTLWNGWWFMSETDQS